MFICFPLMHFLGGNTASGSGLGPLLLCCWCDILFNFACPNILLHFEVGAPDTFVTAVFVQLPSLLFTENNVP